MNSVTIHQLYELMLQIDQHMLTQKHLSYIGFVLSMMLISAIFISSLLQMKLQSQVKRLNAERHVYVTNALDQLMANISDLRLRVSLLEDRENAYD